MSNPIHIEIYGSGHLWSYRLRRCGRILASAHGYNTRRNAKRAVLALIGGLLSMKSGWEKRIHVLLK